MECDARCVHTIAAAGAVTNKDSILFGIACAMGDMAEFYLGT